MMRALTMGLALRRAPARNGQSRSLRERTAHSLRCALGRWERRIAEYEVLRELSGLSDRELADLGIDRARVVTMARQAARTELAPPAGG